MSTSAFSIQVAAPPGAIVTVSVTRTDINTVLLSAVAMTSIGSGKYQLIPPLTDPAAGLTYSVTWFINGIDVVTLQQRGGGGATGHYAAQSDLENRYGSTNVADWSHLDGETGNANQTRILTELTFADNVIYDRFRLSAYDPPPVTPITTRWAVVITGNALYHNRGQRTEGEANNQYSTDLAAVMSEMNLYVAGVKFFPSGRAINFPTTPIMVGI